MPGVPEGLNKWTSSQMRERETVTAYMTGWVLRGQPAERREFTFYQLFLTPYSPITWCSNLPGWWEAACMLWSLQGHVIAFDENLFVTALCSKHLFGPRFPSGRRLAWSQRQMPSALFHSWLFPALALACPVSLVFALGSTSVRLGGIPGLCLFSGVPYRDHYNF